MCINTNSKNLYTFVLLLVLFISNAYSQAETHWQNAPLFETSELNSPRYSGSSYGAVCSLASAAYKNFSNTYYKYEFTVGLKNGQCEVKTVVTNQFDHSNWETRGVVGITSRCVIEPYPILTPKVEGARYDAAIATQTKNECSYFCPAGSIRVGNNYCQPQPCPIQPLTALTGDALAFENGNRVRIDGLSANMQTALANLQASVAAARGTLTVTSAWRPQGYQDHLRQILTRRNELNDKTRIKNFPQCAALRAIVNTESTAHGLGSEVGITSNHTPGNAFDAHWTGISDAEIDTLANAAGLFRPFPRNDGVHFQLR